MIVGKKTDCTAGVLLRYSLFFFYAGWDAEETQWMMRMALSMSLFLLMGISVKPHS